ncbi:MAG: S-layer homology domain-containing protein [Syntrophomonadaceae bacterium]|nr:S-layer homology domain-containing protein [Syntrophomonadaceae bacterium]
MRKRIISLALALVMCLSLLPMTALASSDDNNGDWAAKTLTLKNTDEAELMVRTGDIDAMNDSNAIANGYSPFTAKNQRPHSFPWTDDAADPTGTDRMYIGSQWSGGGKDGYSKYVTAPGALTISMRYDAAGITVKNALLQLCIDDFQALNWGTSFSVTLNGRSAPFIAELLNQVDQTGPTSYIVSAVIPSGFFNEIASGELIIAIDETTGLGDGYAVDFAKLLVNYQDSLFTGDFSGTTQPGATVRLLGTSTTVTAAADGSFTFEAIPGLNAVRASTSGYVENYEFGIVLASGTEWAPDVRLSAGTGSPDIDFSQFGSTDAWANASDWATEELAEADELGLIPEVLEGADLTQDITRAEFAAVAVKVYEALSGTAAIPAVNNPFTDTSDVEVLKAYNIGAVNGTSDTTFTPDALLNREQAATMLTRVFKKVSLVGWTLATDSEFTLTYTKPAAFADDADISGYAKDSVYFMAANGIIGGMGDNKFAPQNITTEEQATGYANATREQALLIAVRMVKNLEV